MFSKSRIVVKQIESIMTDGAASPFRSLKFFLYALSVVYGGYQILRQNFFIRGILPSERLPCVVISIGNLTLGGTGKTPMTLHVAERLRRLGYKTAVLSRGYKGGAEKSGGIVSDGQTVLMGPEMAGDEPYMMALRLDNIPVLVGKQRFKSGMLAIKTFNPDILVLDDAFQHLRLRRDLDLVLLDYRRPFGNRHLLPRGVLREPLSALGRGDAFILTRSDAAPDSETADSLAYLQRYTKGKPLFRAKHIPRVQKVIQGSPAACKRGRALRYDDGLQGRRVFAFSGLANNQDFHRTLAGMSCVLTGALEFADHHAYSAMELDKTVRLAMQARADCLVTTEKDFARVSHRIKLPVDLVVVGLESTFGSDQDAFIEFIRSRITVSEQKIAENPAGGR